MPRPYYREFLRQRSGAKQRGIGWNLTYEQWIEWWGDDIARRGQGYNQLQMQRPADSGPYEIGNIRKGTPRENIITWQSVRAVRQSEERGRANHAALMAAPSDCDALDEDPEDLPISEYFARDQSLASVTYDPEAYAHGHRPGRS